MKKSQLSRVWRSSLKCLVLFLLVLACGPGPVGQSKSRRYGKLSSYSALGGKPQTSRMIDGSKNPRDVPDHVAYSMLFRFLGRSQTPGHISRVRGYIREMGFADYPCQSCPKQIEGDQADVDTLLSVAQEYEQRVGILDNAAKEIKARTWNSPNQRSMPELSELQRQKEVILDEMLLAVTTRMSAQAKAKIRKHLDERIKPRVKIRIPDQNQ